MLIRVCDLLLISSHSLDGFISFDFYTVLVRDCLSNKERKPMIICKILKFDYILVYNKELIIRKNVSESCNF